MTYTLHHFETLLADDWRVRDEDENEIACFSEERFARLFMDALAETPALAEDDKGDHTNNAVDA